MTQFVFENFVNTMLADAASSMATTLTLSTATGLPSTLAQGQQIPLVLNSASNGSVFETCYITGINGATVTVLRAQEGTSAQRWNVGDFAYVAMTAGSTAPVIATHSPTASETLPVANQLVVTPGTLTAGIDLTLNDTAAAGSGVTIYGSAADYAVTVQSPVTTGSPYIELPDGAQVCSLAIPAASPSQGIRVDWDGTNWRAQTFGHTVVAPAVEDNEAVQLGQLTDGSFSPTFDNITAASADISGGQSIGGALAVNGAATFISGLTLNGNSYLEIDSPSSLNGANIALIGNGTATPTKYLRAQDGNFNIVNDAYSEAILSLDESGNLSIPGNFGAVGTVSASAGTSGDEVVNYTQITNGSLSPSFGSGSFIGQLSIPSATANNQAVSAGQLLGTLGVGASHSIYPTTSISVTTGTFTAPCNGKCIVLGFLGQETSAYPIITMSSSLSGLTVVNNGCYSYNGFVYGELPMSSGQSSTFTIVGSASKSIGMGVSIFAIWTPEPLGGN